MRWLWRTIFVLMSAVTAAKAHLLSYYETLSYDRTPHKFIHAAALRGEDVGSWHLHFYAHQRTFDLKFQRASADSSSSGSEYYQQIVAVEAAGTDAVFGVLHEDGVFTGSILTENGTFWVEHSQDFEPPSPLLHRHHSIIYHEKDIRMPTGNSTHPVQFCATKPSPPPPAPSAPPAQASARDDLLFRVPESETNRMKLTMESGNHRLRRAIHPPPPPPPPPQPQQIKEAFFCPVEVSTDIRVWKKFHRPGDSENFTRKRIIGKTIILLHRASLVYSKTVFFDRFREITNMQFSLQNMDIYSPQRCSQPHNLNNVLCSTVDYDSAEFLLKYSELDHGRYCVSFAFTTTVFSGGTIGIAYLPNDGQSGLCAHKQNTGVITFQSHDENIPLLKLGLTLAHEIGHLCGSTHDDLPENDDHPECDPPGGLDEKFIMFSRAVNGGNSRRNYQFSSCSKKAMAVSIGDMYGTDCFQSKKSSFCGNTIREHLEQCDCGPAQSCADMCCHPSNSPLTNETCRLSAGARCSVSGDYANNFCCDPESCQPKNGTVTECRSETDCLLPAHCDGATGLCHTQKHKPDHSTLCNRNRRTCVSGSCVGSLCDFVKGWEECAHPAHPCHLACRRVGSRDCVSTVDLPPAHELLILLYKWSESEENRKTHRAGIQKLPGESCDLGRGFCDHRRVCKTIDYRTLIERLKTFMGRSKEFYTIIVSKWWTMILAVIVVIFMSFVMMIFVAKDSSFKIHQQDLRASRREFLESQASEEFFDRRLTVQPSPILPADAEIPGNQNLRVKFSSWRKKSLKSRNQPAQLENQHQENLPTPRSLSFQTEI